MDKEIRVPIALPLDSDGFLRRECPTCGREFKWFAHDDGDYDAEPATQHFCPLCGVAAGLGSWWTPAQLDHGFGSAGPAIDQFVKDAVADMLKGMEGITFNSNSSFSAGVDTPDPLAEPNDMVIVEPPCHPNEPLKIPEDAAGRIYCLICGSAFAA